MSLRTRVTDRLGVEHPIVLAPMGRWADANLAAAVSNAGGLGTFGAAGKLMGFTERRVRDTIAAVRDRTDKPFGAGFITQLIPEEPAILDAVLEEEVPVVLFSFADPTPNVQLAKQTSATVIGQAHTLEAAEVAVAAGADIIAVQGNEAGGHTGQRNLLPFLVQVVEAFPEVPVLAAGGISNGRALSAVLAAGAEGAWMGTALLAASEATVVQPGHLDAILRSDGSDTVYSSIVDVFIERAVGMAPWPEGIALRSARNELLEHWLGRSAGELEVELPDAVESFGQGLRAGDPAVMPYLYGEGARWVTSQQPAQVIISTIVADAQARLGRG